MHDRLSRNEFVGEMSVSCTNSQDSESSRSNWGLLSAMYLRFHSICSPLWPLTSQAWTGGVTGKYNKVVSQG